MRKNLHLLYTILIVLLMPFILAEENSNVAQPSSTLSPECSGLSDEECKKLFEEKPSENTILPPEPLGEPIISEDTILPQECTGLSNDECEKLFKEKDTETDMEDTKSEEDEKIIEQSLSESVNIELEAIGKERTKVEVKIIKSGEKSEYEFELETIERSIILDEIVKRTGLDRNLVEKMVFIKPYDPSQETIEVPENCVIEDGEFGKFVRCEKEDDFLKDIKEKCKNYGGEFSIGKFGPECIFEKEGSLFGEMQCPNENDLERMKKQCVENKGTPENFIDSIGCPNILCNFAYEKEQYKNEEDKFFNECSAGGGKSVFIKGESRCYNPNEKTKIKEEFEPLESTELLKIALKIENIITNLIEVGENFEKLKSFYEERGDDEKRLIFESAISKINSAAARLEEIKAGLAQKAGKFTKEDRIQVLQDIQSIKNIIQEIAINILTGKSEVSYKVDEKDFMQAIRHCEDFSRDNIYNFNPDQNTKAELFGLDDKSRCIMVVNSGEFGKMEFLIPSKIYPFLKGPELLLSKEIECNPEETCEKMKSSIKRDEEYERFGEKERLESSECEEAGATGEECFKLIFEQGKLYECRDLSFEECKELMFKHRFEGGEFDE